MTNSNKNTLAVLDIILFGLFLFIITFGGIFFMIYYQEIASKNYINDENNYFNITVLWKKESIGERGYTIYHIGDGGNIYKVSLKDYMKVKENKSYSIVCENKYDNKYTIIHEVII